MKMKKQLLWIAGGIIGGALVLAIASSWNDSLIVDEIPHIGAGYSYLKKLDMRLNPEHPPLAKDLAALPLLFLNMSRQVFQTASWLTDINGQWEFGRSLIFGNGNDADQIKHLARLPMLLFFVLTALLVFRWTLERYGDTGALIALILFAFSPTVIAHSRFVTTDVPAMFGIMLATYYFVRYLQKPTRRSMIIAAITFGVALLTKFSTFLLVPSLTIVAIAYGVAKTSGHWKEKTAKGIAEGTAAILIFIIGFTLIVWPLYYLQTVNYPPERQRSDTEFLLRPFTFRPLADTAIWMADKPVIRAAGHYALGLLMVGQRSEGGNTIYFLGEVRKYGGPLYFPIVYFLKEPFAWWIMVVIALITLAIRPGRADKKKGKAQPWIKEYLPEFAMLMWMAVYWGVSMDSHLNIGVRHLLPIYPFAIMLVSGRLAIFAKRIKTIGRAHLRDFTILIALLLGWYVFENVRVFPYYLTYFNQVAGGAENGHRYVTDSNLDWGQDLIRLARWTEENDIPRIEVDYFGWADPAYYMGSRFVRVTADTYSDARDFLARNTANGWIAISDTFFHQATAIGNMGDYRWLLPYEPTTTIGNSVHVWHITR